jgi:hypothetical protein
MVYVSLLLFTVYGYPFGLLFMVYGSLLLFTVYGYPVGLLFMVYGYPFGLQGIINRK